MVFCFVFHNRANASLLYPFYLIAIVLRLFFTHVISSHTQFALCFTYLFLGSGMAIAWNTLYAGPLKHKYAENSKGSGNINGQQMKH
jgi:hypothetical protein